MSISGPSDQNPSVGGAYAGAPVSNESSASNTSKPAATDVAWSIIKSAGQTVSKTGDDLSKEDKQTLQNAIHDGNKAMDVINNPSAPPREKENARITLTQVALIIAAYAATSQQSLVLATKRVDVNNAQKMKMINAMAVGMRFELLTGNKVSTKEMQKASQFNMVQNAKEQGNMQLVQQTDQQGQLDATGVSSSESTNEQNQNLYSKVTKLTTDCILRLAGMT